VEWAWSRVDAGCQARTRGRGRCSEWMPIRNRESGIGRGQDRAGQDRALGQGRHSGEGRCIKTRPPGRRRQASEGRRARVRARAWAQAQQPAVSLEACGLWAGCGLAVAAGGGGGCLSSSAGPPGAGARQGSLVACAHWLRRARWCHGDGYGHFPKPAIDEVQARFFRRPDIRACIGAPTHVFWRKNRVYSPKARCWVYWRGESTGGRPGWHGAPRA
jgi:hypothetical protein